MTEVGGTIRAAVTGLAVLLLVAGCASTPAAPTPSTAAPTAGFIPTPVPSPATAGAAPSDASPDLRAAQVAEAAARWAAAKPPSYALTLFHLGPGGTGWDFRYRVVSLEGWAQAQWLGGLTQRAGDVDRMTVDGLFETARRELEAPGDTRVTFDVNLGYPTEIVHIDETPSDGSWTETATEFASPSGGVRVARLREVLAEARTAWARWEPADYAYTWRRFTAAAEPGDGTSWLVESSGSRATSHPGPGSDGAYPASDATVAATFDSIGSALDAGAWVDLTVDATSGLPLLVAVDPSPERAGDAYWIEVTFRDIEGEVATSTLEAAKVRFAAAGLQRFSYTWRYRGDLDPLTYHVTMVGDVSKLRREPGTPIPEARSYAAPRIDDTFRMIEAVLAEGGRVHATYDPLLGYPLRVELDPAGETGAKGVITVSDFTIP